MYRVTRVIEYVGSEEDVRRILSRSLRDGITRLGGCQIAVTTVPCCEAKQDQYPSEPHASDPTSISLQSDEYPEDP